MAAEHEADLIVVAVPAATGVGKGRFGAVAEAIVRGARVPVVLVPVDRPHQGSDL
jgi:nucleotide-binding universal stress UspA family protein